VTWTSQHPVGRALRDAAHGRFPTVDGVAEIVEPDEHGTHAVVSFTGRSFLLTTADPDALRSLGIDGYGGATDPRVLLLVAGTRGTVGTLDVVMVRSGRGGGTPLTERHDLDDHPRLQRARHHRRHVRVLGDDRGFVTIGQGLLGRTEISIELTDAEHGRGAGRELLIDALGALPNEELVFAQVAPGNAASLRAFLACGFVPIGSEVLIEPM
jgi:hypothetical protein